MFVLVLGFACLGYGIWNLEREERTLLDLDLDLDYRICCMYAQFVRNGLEWKVSSGLGFDLSTDLACLCHTLCVICASFRSPYRGILSLFLQPF